MGDLGPVEKLDFNEFHPLDHWPGGSYCRSLPGGMSHHWSLDWEFRHKPAIRSFLRKPWCWAGRHYREEWFSYPNGLRDRSVRLCHPMCRDCRKKLPVG